MNVIGNMHGLRLPNISILSYIICYISSLTIIIVLTIKAVGFTKIRKTFSNIFAMHCGEIKD